MSRPLYIRTHTLLLQQVGPSLRPIKFLSFFGMHGTEFEIIDGITGSNVDLAKERIVSRIMRLLDLAVESLGSGLQRTAEKTSPFLPPRRSRWRRFIPKSVAKTLYCLSFPARSF